MDYVRGYFDLETKVRLSPMLPERLVIDASGLDPYLPLQTLSFPGSTKDSSFF